MVLHNYIIGFPDITVGIKGKVTALFVVGIRIALESCFYSVTAEKCCRLSAESLSFKFYICVCQRSLLLNIIYLYIICEKRTAGEKRTRLSDGSAVQYNII